MSDEGTAGDGTVRGEGRRELKRARAWPTVLCWAGVAGVAAWSVLRMWRGSARLETGDFKHFFWAAEAMGQGGTPYGSGLGGYIYPPLFAWVIQPLVELGRVGAERAWGCVNLALLGLTVWLGARVVMARLPGGEGAAARGRRMAAVVLAALLLTVEPVRWVFEEGQTDSVVLACLVVFLALEDRRPRWWCAGAGAALGAAVQVKHQAWLCVPYLIVRRRWGVLAGMLIASGLLAVVPAVTLGWARTAAYLGTAYGYLGRLLGGSEREAGLNLHPITWELSVSIPSAVARALDGPGGVPMAGVAAAVGAIAAAVFGVTWYMYRANGRTMFAAGDRVCGAGGLKDRARGGLVLLEWCGLIVALLVFSPQTMVRHTYLLLGVHLVAADLMLVRRAGVPRWPVVAGVVVAQLGMRLPPGHDAFEEALNAWRRVGGASWCVLAMWFGVLWTGLRVLPRGDGGQGALGRS